MLVVEKDLSQFFRRFLNNHYPAMVENGYKKDAGLLNFVFCLCQTIAWRIARPRSTSGLSPQRCASV
jgi:hypothetical protein